MKRLWFAWCFCAMAANGMAYPDVSPRIINGDPVFDTNAEFYVALMAPFSWTGSPAGSHWNPFCGGTYLGDGLIITAAHCTDFIVQGATFGVVLGNQNATGEMLYEYCNSSKPQGCKAGTDTDLAGSEGFNGYYYTHYLAYVGDDAIEVKRSNSTVLQHPAYRPYGHDLALIKLSSIPGSATLSLPTTDTWQSSLGRDYQVVGHGDTLSDLKDSTFEPSAELLYVDIASRSDTLCSNLYGGSFEADNMLCAGNPSSNPNLFGEDSCQGDSGGPLFDSNTNTLVGVVSWGGQCARYYGVYADVFAMRHWINTARANLDGTYRFPQAIDFGVGTEKLSGTLFWTFRNTGGSPVTLSNFNFNNLSGGYSMLGNGCEGAELSSGQTCSLTLSASFTSLGYHNESFTFEAGTETMEVNALARVARKSNGGTFGLWALLLIPVLTVMRGRRLLALTGAMAAVVTLSACSSMSGKATGEPEVLFNPEVKAEGLEFSVVSHGCTEDDHLFLRVEGNSLTLLRTQKDRCRTAPQLLRFVMPLPVSDNVWQIENPVRYSNRVGLSGAQPQ